MRKTAISLAMLGGLMAACSSHDPILPGDRTAIFDTANLTILNTEIPNAPTDAPEPVATDCPYTRDTSNVVWMGDRKIFSGFATPNFVKSDAQPICHGGFVYVGLTTGEVVKVNQKNRQIAWIADVYRPSNMTGGASVLDIVAPIVISGGAVYAGGIGDAFCRINNANGTRTWCVDVGTATPFIVADAVAYVVATDNNLYAINTKNGDIYWRTPIRKQATPHLANGRVTVGRQHFDAATGVEITSGK
ncbi:MAG: PQQ-like beta-propeller repeat protein [Alphaproteobacteria bacterium]|nr:PQQ-like beta-propeller repeat protein [Alphaproteobacteria bacterium]